MRFMYVALHYPLQQHAADLLGAMQKLAMAIGKVPGMVEATAWQEKGGARIVATSIWTSEEALLQALPVIGGAVKGVPFEQWEARPRELLRLDEIA
jgi:hypothetical protein